MPDADPKDKVGDVEGPADGSIESPGSDPHDELVADGRHSQEENAEGQQKCQPPQPARASLERQRKCPSVTWAAVLSPAIHGVCAGRETLAMLLVAFRRTIPHDSEITHRGPNVEFPQNLVAARVGRRAATTRLAGSLRLPNTIAWAGHDCWQAVSITPSRGTCPPASLLASWMRCTQKVHFSITPRDRTVTSGLRMRFCENVVVGIIKPIEPPHFVGTVVRAVAGAHTTVINLLIQPFVAVHGRQYRADDLAGRVAAMLAQHGLMGDVHTAVSFGVVAVNSQPVHFALPPHLVFADHGNVVFRLAGNHARGTARAGIQIDDHAPPRAASPGDPRATNPASFLPAPVRPDVLAGAALGLVSQFFLISRERCLTDDGPSFLTRQRQVRGHRDLVITLRGGQRVLPVGLR